MGQALDASKETGWEKGGNEEIGETTRQSISSSVGVRVSEGRVEAVESEVRDEPLSRSNGSFSVDSELTVDCSRGYRERLCGGRVLVRE